MYLKRLASVILFICLIITSGCVMESDVLAPEDIVPVSSVVEVGQEEAKPRTRPDGKPFRVGVIDIDPYPYSGKLVYYVIDALRKAGWIVIDEIPFDPENTDVKEMITYLAKTGTGSYLQFVEDCTYYLAYDGEQAVKESLNEHIYQLKDIDMLLALGTWPANVAKPYAAAVPVVCYPLSAAKESGVVENHDYSGVKNLWAQTDPERHIRQMRVFHEVVGFTRIGAVYYDKDVAAIADYEQSAAQLGVEMVSREIEPLPSDPTSEDIERYYSTFHSAVKRLYEEGIDAFLLTTDMIKDDNELSIFMNEVGAVPVCVQSGDNFVESGCLLTVDVYNASELGYFVADTIGQILNGKKPEELPQTYISTPYLVLNLNTLKELEIQASFELLMSSEKIYYTGALGEERQ